jgi:hypothetical protein
VDELEAIVARIEESPAQFPVWQGNPRFRKAVLPESSRSSCFFVSWTTASASLRSLTVLASPGIGSVASEPFRVRVVVG